MPKKGGSIRRSNRTRKALRRTKKNNLTPKYASLNLSPRKRSTPKKPSSGVKHANIRPMSKLTRRKALKQKSSY